MGKFLNFKKSFFIKYLLLFITLSLLLILSSCPNDTDLLNNSDKEFFGYLYNSKDNTIQLNELFLEKNVVDLYKSPDSSWIIYSKIVEDGGVDLFKIHREQSFPERITFTPNDYEFHAAIDNYGNIAWASHKATERMILSHVFLNGIEINIPVNNLYKHCYFYENHLYFSMNTENNDTQNMIIFDLLTFEYETIEVPFIIGDIFCIGNSLLLEGFDLINYQYNIYIYDLINKEFKIEQEMAVYFEGNIISVKNISNKHVVLLMIERTFLKHDPFLSIAAMNNYRGRLSWFITYRMEGLLYLYLAGGLSNRYDNEFIKNILIRSVNEIIQSFDNNYVGWPTKFYSIDRETKLSTFVENVRLMYSLLYICNHSDIVNEVSRKEIFEIAEKIYEFYEKDFNNDLNMYTFTRGIKQYYDGVPLPFNQQNIFGLVLIEFYLATQDEKYKERVFLLAKNFKQEFIYINNILIWRYWPQFFYNGWTVSDNLSNNTPSRKPEINPAYEDLSHAGSNVVFILKFIEMFGEDVFTNYDVEYIKNTMKNFKHDNFFSYRIDGSSQNISSWAFPEYGWYILYNYDYLKFIFGRSPIYTIWDNARIMQFIGILNLLQ